MLLHLLFAVLLGGSADEIRLARFSAAELDRLTHPGPSGLVPAGVSRKLRIDPIEDRVVVAWPGAGDLRLHARVAVGEGARIRITGSDDVSIVADVPREGVWLPASKGDEVTIDVEHGTVVFDRVNASLSPAALDDCAINAGCIDDEDTARYASAVATYSFIHDSDGQRYVCTGALVADRMRSGTPYFLTARHCIKSAAEAASMDVNFGYRATCGSTFAVPEERIAGATVLATGIDGDFTLLRLARTPVTPRWFLGWTRTPPADGALLTRISHPHGLPQQYSTSRVIANARACNFRGVGYTSSPAWIPSRPELGDVDRGSSGSPVWIAGGLLAGHATGACPAEPCTERVMYDGSFAHYFPHLAPWLDPARRRAIDR